MLAERTDPETRSIVPTNSIVNFQFNGSMDSQMVTARRRQWLMDAGFDHMAEYEAGRRVLKDGAKIPGLSMFEMETFGENGESSRSALLNLGGSAAAELHQYGQFVQFTVYSQSSGRHAVQGLTKLLEELTDLYVAPEPVGELLVELGFWNQGDFGADRSERTLEMREWSAIERNYSKSCSSALGNLVKLQSIPDQEGKLILMHGPAGSGKTNLIRALAFEWQEWTQFDIIMDPETFLTSPKYLNDVMMRPLYDEDAWRVLVMEDCGELLGGDAKERAGQGLSRLLNISDGILGQGQKLLFIITTNEDIQDLHSAVIRPGRCFSNLQVGKLSAEEAGAWLSSDRESVFVTEPMTLAELYQFKSKTEAAVNG